MIVINWRFANQVLFTLANRYKIRSVQKKNSSPDFIFRRNGFVAKIGAHSCRRR